MRCLVACRGSLLAAYGHIYFCTKNSPFEEGCIDYKRCFWKYPLELSSHAKFCYMKLVA